MGTEQSSPQQAPADRLHTGPRSSGISKHRLMNDFPDGERSPCAPRVHCVLEAFVQSGFKGLLCHLQL